MRIQTVAIAIALIAVLAITPLVSAANLPQIPPDEDSLPIFPKDYGAYAKSKQYTSLKQFYDQVGYWNQTSDTLRALIMYKSSELVYAPEGVQIHKVYKTMPLASVTVDRKRFKELSNLEGIKKVYLDQKFETTANFNFLKDGKLNLKPNAYYPFIGKYPTLLNETTKMIGAQDLWKKGIMGNNTVIAILDTGFDSTHPNLDHLGNDQKAKKVIKEISMIDIPEEKGDTSDQVGHGTHVAGIASSNGAAGSPTFIGTAVGTQILNASILPNTQMGVAPMAKLYNVKVLSNQGFGLLSWIISGMEWATENGADVISMSLGAYPFFLDDDPLAMAVEKAVKGNVTVVTSAGNAGPSYFAVGTPGKARDAIAVGATYGTGHLIYFSSRGPASYDLIQKPDLIAPGMVVSNWAFYKQFERTFYLEIAGTSMAAPHVAGAAALLKQAFPGASPYAIKAALLQGANDMGLDPSVQGAGFVNVAKAYEILAQAQADRRKIDAPEVKLDSTRPISNFTGSLAGVKVLFIGDVRNHNSFLTKLNDEGAKIFVKTAGNLTIRNLDGIDVLILAEPKNLSDPRYNPISINAFVGNGKALFIIGDELRTGYDALTKQYGITWSPLGMGGYSTKIASHASTQGVKQLWFGGPIASLKVDPNVATVIAFDPLYPAAAVWKDPTGRGKVFVLADDDVLNNFNIDVADNAAFGLSVISYLAADKIATRPQIHEVAVGLRYPQYIVNGSSISFKVNITNYGSFDERVALSVNVTNEIGKVVHSTRLTIDQIKPGLSSIQEIMTDSLTTKSPFANFKIVAQGRIPFGEIDFTNNKIVTSFDVISRSEKAGLNPRLAIFAPSRITSSLLPTTTYFPGDFKVFNVTLLTSYQIKDAKVRIVGDASQFTSFSNAKKLVQTLVFFDFPDSTPLTFNYGKKFDAGKELSIGNMVGYKGLPIQIIIPEDAKQGTYLGAIELVEGDKVTLRAPIELSVSKPKEKILFDDVFHGVDFFGTVVPVEVRRLWGGSFRAPAPTDWYSYLSKQGFQLVSLKQYMNKTNTFDPWKVFMSGQFKNLVLHHTTLQRQRTGVFPLLLKNGTNIEVHYDVSFQGRPLGPATVDPSNGFFGIIANINASNPVGRGIANATFAFGVELATRPGSQVIATAANPANPVQSGVVAASFKTDGGGKFVAIGDSSLFEFTDDWFWFVNYLFSGVNGTTTGELQLGANALSYLTNKPPAISNLATDKPSYGAGSQAELRFSTPTAKTAKISLMDAQGKVISTIDQAAVADNRVMVPLPDKLTPGAYSVGVRAMDDMGDISERVLTLTIKNTIPPSLQIVSPKADEKIIGTTRIDVLGEAKSPGNMELFIDNDKVQSWSDIGARSYVWDTSKTPEGQHKIRVLALDQDGNQNEVSLNIAVARPPKPPKAPPPTLQIVNPIPNEKLIGVMRIEVLGEAKAPGSMELFIDNEKVQGWSDIGARSYVWNASLASEGSHKIRVTAADADGNKNEASIDVIVARPPAPPPPPPPPLLTKTEIIIIAMNIVTIVAIVAVLLRRNRRG